MPTILSHALAAGAAGGWWRRPLPRRFWAWTIVCSMLPDADVIGFSFGIRYDDMVGHRGFTHSLFFAAVVGVIAAWHLSHPSHPSHGPGSDSHRPGTDSHLSHPSHGPGSASHRPGTDSHRPESDSHRPESASHPSHGPGSDSHRPESDSHHPASDSRTALFIWFTAIAASHGLLDAMTDGGRGIAFFAPFSNHRYFFPWRPIQVSPIGVGFFAARGLAVLASEARWIWVPSAIMAASARLFRK